MSAGPIFVSYRREDTAWAASALYADLNRQFRGRVFMDVDSIPVGMDFVAYLQKHIDRSRVLIVLIGEHWATPRLRDRRDFVHIEVARALEQNKLVIPVLLDNAPMPTEADVPYRLDGLLRRQALRLRRDSYPADLANLVKQIRAARSGVNVAGLLPARWSRPSRRHEIENIFAERLDTDLINTLAAGHEFDTASTQVRQTTVMFCGLMGLTAFSESIAPEEAISHLSDLLTPFTDAIIRHRGLVDKVLADWLQAIWNAPLDDPTPEANACAAALDMQDTLARINQTFTALGLGSFRSGVALTTGACVVGPMGSRRRPEYSCFGDPVDFAARLQSLTRTYGAWILMDTATANPVLNRFAIVEIDRIAIVGRARHESVFALLGDESVGADPGFQRFASCYQGARAAYLNQDWDTAKATYLEASAQKLANVDSVGLCNPPLSRIEQLRNSPPGDNWDGIFRWTELTSK